MEFLLIRRVFFFLDREPENGLKELRMSALFRNGVVMVLAAGDIPAGSLGSNSMSGEATILISRALVGLQR